MYRSKHIAAAGNLEVADKGELGIVNVNKGASGATFTVYNGTSASGEVIAEIDAENPGCFAYGVFCSRGIFGVLAGGDADVTVSFG